MDTTKKHYIEFCDNIFALEDVLRIENHARSYIDSNTKEKVCQSYIYFNIPDKGFYFPEDKYEQIKQTVFDYSKGKEIQNIEN